MIYGVSMQNNYFIGKCVFIIYVDVFMGLVLCEVYRERGVDVINDIYFLIDVDELD